jgi:hypothetical protein
VSFQLASRNRVSQVPQDATKLGGCSRRSSGGGAALHEKHAGLFASALNSRAALRPTPAPVPAQEARVDVAWPGGGEALYVTELEGSKARRSGDEVHHGGMDDEEESDGVHVLNASCLSRNSAIRYTLHILFIWSICLRGLWQVSFLLARFVHSLDYPLRNLTGFSTVHDFY